jgi:endonuclease/exonuclease/phosphatase family metal-dependent hydrolase
MAEPKNRVAHGCVCVVTYNLWGFGEPWTYTAARGESRGAVPGSPAATLRLADGVWRRRRSLVGKVLRQLQPDLVGLQEVRIDPVTRTSHAEQLAVDLAYDYAFQPILTVPYGDEPGAEGLAVLSRCPIHSCQEIPQVGGMHTIVELPSGAVDFLVVHLTLQREAQLGAVEHLQAYLKALPKERPFLLVGDFNGVPQSEPVRVLLGGEGGQQQSLHDAWQEVNPDDPGPTMPSQAPVIRIDYIFTSGAWSVVWADRFGQESDTDGFYPSDHLSVAATIRLSSLERQTQLLLSEADKHQLPIRRLLLW